MEASADDFHKVPGPQVIRSIAAHFEDGSISQQVMRIGSCVSPGHTLKKETMNWRLSGFQRRRGRPRGIYMPVDGTARSTSLYSRRLIIFGERSKRNISILVLEFWCTRLFQMSGPILHKGGRSCILKAFQREDSSLKCRDFGEKVSIARLAEHSWTHQTCPLRLYVSKSDTYMLPNVHSQRKTSWDDPNEPWNKQTTL
jgi:hypothetical protein